MKKTLSLPDWGISIGIRGSAIYSIDFIRSGKFNITSKDSLPLDSNFKNQFQGYFSGNLKQFDLNLDLIGTPFQIDVWNALQTIPFGKTVTYSQIATMIGRPKAVRAVGTAIGRNPIPVIVPCHRVIASNGKLGGYSGGLDIKIKLLEIESN